MSKIEAGQMVIRKRNFNLSRLLDDIEEMFQLRVQGKNLVMICQRAADLPHTIFMDDVKLRQVLINLISNAVKFTDTGSIVLDVMRSISAEQPRLSFTVTDTGSGIASEQLTRIFEAFVQADAGIESLEGTGLGLTISRSFVQKMGGELQIESQLGQGTKIYFDIPLDVVDEQDVADPQANFGRRVVGIVPQSTPYRILVVDDQWSARHLLVQFLEPLGFDMREATNGQEAVEMSRSWQPHLIWMDMNMPVLTGWEATRQIKQTAESAEIPIIALTASVLEEDRLKILQSGCDDYLRKPFYEKDILALMQHYLGVQYLYEDTAPAGVTKTAEAGVFSIRDALLALPQSLRSELEYVTILLDEALVNEVLEKVRSHHAALADELQILADGFKYGEITAHLQDV